MVVTKRYPVPNRANLYVEGLVKCMTCGSKDEFEGPESFDKLTDQPHNVQSLEEYSSCSICDHNTWKIHKEVCHLRIPTSIGTVETLSNFSDKIDVLHDRLDVLETHGFYVDQITTNNLIVLMKNTD